jgi:Mg-chelatase subunit ChlD
MRVTGVKRNPNITLVTTTTTSTTNKKARIHNVFIVDASGSMGDDGKYSIAISGLNEILKSIKADTDTDNTIMIVEFEGSSIVTTLKLTNDIPYSYKGMGIGGMTPLNQAIGETIESIVNTRSKSFDIEDKILINIFTDGQENASSGKYAGFMGERLLGQMINELKEQGVTVTFVGTKNEVNYAISSLGLSQSNTLTHENTAKTVRMAFDSTVMARKSYSKSVSLGEDVSASFYTKTLLKTENEENK